jgi:hypothetical protein
MSCRRSKGQRLVVILPSRLPTLPVVRKVLLEQVLDGFTRSIRISSVTACSVVHVT